MLRLTHHAQVDTTEAEAKEGQSLSFVLLFFN